MFYIQTLGGDLLSQTQKRYNRVNGYTFKLFFMIIGARDL